MKGKKKLLVFAPVIAVVASALSGCGVGKDALASINDAALDALNASPIACETVDEGYDKFDFLSADFTETDTSDYDVDISGIAKYNHSQKAFVKMSYTLDGENFVEINGKSEDEILNMLASLIGKEEMKAFDFAPVGSFKALNGTVKKTAESPLDGFDYKRGVIFSLGDVKFDEETKGVSFRMKTHVEYTKETTTLQPVAMVDADGMTTIGWLPMPTWENEDFIHTNDVYLSLSPAEYEAMKEDNSLIFDRFVEMVNAGNKDRYVIKSTEIERPTKFDVSKIEKNSSFEDEMDM